MDDCVAGTLQVRAGKGPGGWAAEFLLPQMYLPQSALHPTNHRQTATNWGVELGPASSGAP